MTTHLSLKLNKIFTSFRDQVRMGLLFERNGEFYFGLEPKQEKLIGRFYTVKTDYKILKKINYKSGTASFMSTVGYDVYVSFEGCPNKDEIFDLGEVQTKLSYN